MAVRRAALAVHTLEDRAVPAAGSPDLTFGTAGRATAGFVTPTLTADAARAVAVDAAGKLVVAGTVNGDFAVFRYNADGSLDNSFGTGGKAVADLGSSTDAAHAVAIQPDGKIVVAGDTVADGTLTFAVARFTAAGAVDTSFDGDGKLVAHLAFAPSFGNQPLDSSARAVTIDGSGRIVVAGYSREEAAPFGFPQLDEQYAVVRLLPATGAFDPTFDGDGKALVGSHDNVDIANAVVVQPDGKVVVVGETSSLFGGSSDFGLARLTAAGTLDGGFGTGGLAAIDIGFGFGTDVATGVVLVGTDLLAGGYSDAGFGGGDLALARVNALGQPVPTFGTFLNGTAVTDLGGDERGNALIVAGPHVVLAGSTTAGVAVGTVDFATTWFDPATGLPDINVGFNGTAFTDFGTANDVGHGVALAGGTLVTVGGTTNNNGDFALAGYTDMGVADATFDGDGRAATNFGTADVRHDDRAWATLALPDGKVLVAGRSALGGATDSALARFNRDGTLDTTFGTNGRVRASIAGFDQILALARQTDGKVLAAGQADDDFFLARFTVDGNLDSSFDVDGKVLASFPSGGAVTAMTVMADGRIVVAGSANGPVAVARFLPDGQLDATFDFDGMLVDPGATDTPIGVHVGADGSVLVVGGNILVRYLADGRLDQSFGNRGRWVRPAALTGVALSASALRADGKVLVAGRVISATADFLVARLLPNGSIDPTFGGAGTGVKTIDFGGQNDVPTGLALQPDGKVVVAGTSGANQYAVARLTEAGVADATFGTNGLTTGAFGPAGVVTGLALQANGKINLGGWFTPGPDDDVVAIQLRGDNTAPTTNGLGPVNVSEDAAPTVLDVNAAYADAQDTNAQLTYTLVGNTVTNGAVTAGLVNGVLTLTYVPNKYGNGTVTVRATDLDGAATDTPINVTVSAVNDLPTATNDTASATDQAAITVDVLANDTDADLNDPTPDTDQLTIASITPATFGTVAIINNRIRYTPRLNADGIEVLTYTIADRSGATATATLTINVSDVTRPRVLDVRAYYSANKFVRLADRPANLGWSSIKTFQVVFSEPVDVQQDDLSLTGVTGATYTFGSFSYDPLTFTATWTLTGVIGIDRLMLKLDGTTAAGVADAPGENLLGADVVRRFGVLPGDLDGNGLVTAAEAAAVKKQVGKRYPTNKGADVDGDGVVTAKDYAIVKLNVGKRVP